METLFRLVILAQRALSREMEFQADLVSVSVTGSDALIHALHRIQAADDIWERLGTQKASTTLEYIFPAPLASPELLERLDAWLESSAANPAAKRYVREGRDDVARALRAQDKDARR